MNEIEQILAEQERQAATEAPKFTVSEFTELLNGTLEYAYTGVMIEGEVTSFKVNQGKWVFFDLKDEGGSINCFMPVFQLRLPLEDGMKVVVKATPKLTKWGRFSLTVKQILPVGEGNIKKSFEFLKKKLEQEGLFDVSRKRPIPEDLTKIGVISSTQAAGYADFCKIINERWGGLEIQVAHTMVQGLAAAEQIISAIKYFNEKAEMQIIAIMRGGGSADDLAVFNDEALVRAIAESRIPVITGIGHEVDESLADLAADIRASTPSNVAEMLTSEKQAEIQRIKFNVNGVGNKILQEIEQAREGGKTKIKMVGEAVNMKISHLENEIKVKQKVLEGLNPDTILKQGYALVTGKLKEGEMVEIATYESKAKAEIKEVKKRIK
ncbi:exodeoxyribonuclease VII large subunit [Candidatus Saccharibacteria bacterium]|nr:exodeoxyribonuclease VII large subunit [Candidatus Saccharibacteria bacterium]